MFVIGFRGLFTLILLCELKKFESSRGVGRGSGTRPSHPFSLDPSTKQLYLVHTFKPYVVFCEIYAVLILMP